MEKNVHLDLGCGSRARNPYSRDYLIGCDIVELKQLEDLQNFEFISVDLTKTILPFETSTFDSISAFDFIEHVPRQAYDLNGKTWSPFINLMSEIHRILKPNGIFLASTPAYPRAEVFQDPTHVNFITDKTHEYFCGSSPYAQRYGFIGSFDKLRVEWEPQKNIYDKKSSAFKKWYRKNIEYKIFKGGITHLTWELKAIKT